MNIWPEVAAVRSLLHLYQFYALWSFVLAPHSNIKLISENLHHHLIWETGNQTTVPVHYRVQYCNIRERTWNYSKECFNTTHLNCNLTQDFTDPQGSYIVSVEAFMENGTLLWRENSSIFVPIINTVLGPPTVHVAGCDYCLNITIHPPVCHLGSPDKRTFRSVVLEMYSKLQYKVVLIKAGLMNETSEILEYSTEKENFTTTIHHLLPRTNYCISVNVSATTNLNPHAKSSPWKCAVTGPISEPDYYIPAAIGGVSLTSVFLLSLVALYKGGFICLKWTPMPKSLSDFSALKHAFCSGKDQLTPEPLTSVKVEFKGIKKKVQEYSEVSKTDSEDDEGYPEYTQHFGGRTLNSPEHSSISMDMSRDSLLEETSNQSTPLADDDVNSKVCQPLLNENKSVDSVLFAPIMEEKSPHKLLENCSSFNINLNSVLLSDSDESWKECGVSQAPLSQDLETSFTTQAVGTVQGRFLCDPTDMKIGDWPGLSETCPLSETALSNDIEDSISDVDQTFGYMRRK